MKQDQDKVQGAAFVQGSDQVHVLGLGSGGEVRIVDRRRDHRGGVGPRGLTHWSWQGVGPVPGQECGAGKRGGAS